jgi:hypothetical protein
MIDDGLHVSSDMSTLIRVLLRMDSKTDAGASAPVSDVESFIAETNFTWCRNFMATR